MAKYFSFLIILIFLGMVLIVPAGLATGPVKIHDVRVLYNKTDLVVYAVLKNSFTEDMKSAILAGVPTTFTFTLKTYEEVPGWFDKKISRITVKHTIKYDNVKQTFSVFSVDNGPAAVFQDFESAQRVMSELSGIAVAPISELTRGNVYYVRIKAKLEKYRPQSIMRYIFFFASLGDFKTDWSPKQRITY
ncbi:MAG: DUF4390 domain-containing protein [Deltaproteobacteria bacterium]|nr:DUF4390 domain-containing protein [Deltaproteobacteria bacterium]